MSDVDISVIVPTRDRAHLLRACLHSLFAQDLDAGRYEVIVVDDASTDETPDMLVSDSELGRCRSIRMPESMGQAAAKNEGASLARGRILLFLDDDMQAAPGCLRAHLHAHDGQSDIVFGPILPVGIPADGAEAMLASSLAAKFGRLLRDPTPLWPIDASLMPNSSLPRALFAQHGGFDAERFARRREDEEFGVRLWKQGARFVFAPQARTTHHWVKQESQVERDWTEGGAALVRLYGKHPDLAGTQRVFGRLFQRPAWQRRLVFIVAEHLWLMRACVAMCPTSARARIARSLFALRGAMAEAGSRHAFARVFASNPPRHP